VWVEVTKRHTKNISQSRHQAATQPAPQAAILTTSNSDRQQKQQQARGAKRNQPIIAICFVSSLARVRSEGWVIAAMEAVGLASAILTFTSVAVKSREDLA